ASQERWSCGMAVVSSRMSRQSMCSVCRRTGLVTVASIWRLYDVIGSWLLLCWEKRTVERLTEAARFPGNDPEAPADVPKLVKNGRLPSRSRLLRYWLADPHKFRLFHRRHRPPANGPCP